MINNDPKRSLEFIKTPEAAGSLAVQNPLALHTIILLHVLRAIIATLATVFANFFATPAPQTDNEIAEMMRAMVEFYTANPLLFATYTFASGLFVYFIAWVVGRNFGEKRDFLSMQSGFIRLGIVITTLMGAATMIGAVFGTIGQLISFGVTVFLVVISIRAARSILGMRDIVTTLGVLCLMFLALVGALFGLATVIAIIGM